MTKRTSCAIVVLVLVGTLAARPAAAATQWTNPHVLSGPTLLAAPDAPNWCGSYAPDQSWETNPTIAVDPTNRANMVATWVQDWSDAAEVAYSHDGGTHWTKVIPPTTPCTGGPTKYGTGPGVMSLIDPVIGFGLAPDGKHGIVYLAWLELNSPSGCPDAVMVNRSLDGGKIWSQPVAVDTTPCGLDGKPDQAFDSIWLTPDPNVAGTAYISYGKLQTPTDAPWVQDTATTIDGGVHWQTSAVPSVALEEAGAIRVLPNGTLVDLMESAPPQAFRLAKSTTTYGPIQLYVSTSTDHGVTWSAAALAATLSTSDTAFFINSAVRWTDTQYGTLDVAWIEPNLDNTSSDVKLIQSTDGGTSWSAPLTVTAAQGPAVMGANVVAAPTIAVNPNGTIGLGYYDRTTDPTTGALQTNYRVAHSIGSGWTQDFLAGPFDESAATGPDAGTFHSLGDYEGLAPVGNGFAAVFGLSAPMAGANFQMADPPKNTDIFFAQTLG